MKLLALIIATLLSCQPSPALAAAGQELLLFYSNDVNGETAPCG